MRSIYSPQRRKERKGLIYFKKKHLCVLRVSACPTCPVKSLPNEMFTQGQFNRDEISVALISIGAVNYYVPLYTLDIRFAPLFLFNL
jgi:hypothetical protein